MKNYVICTEEDGEKGYIAFDETSGGYPWMPSTLRNAEIFDDLEKARKAVNSLTGTGYDKSETFICEVVLKRV